MFHVHFSHHHRQPYIHQTRILTWLLILFAPTFSILLLSGPSHHFWFQFVVLVFGTLIGGVLGPVFVPGSIKNGVVDLNVLGIVYLVMGIVLWFLW